MTFGDPNKHQPITQKNLLSSAYRLIVVLHKNDGTDVRHSNHAHTKHKTNRRHQATPTQPKYILLKVMATWFVQAMLY